MRSYSTATAPPDTPKKTSTSLAWLFLNPNRKQLDPIFSIARYSFPKVLWRRVLCLDPHASWSLYLTIECSLHHAGWKSSIYGAKMARRASFYFSACGFILRTRTRMRL